MKIDDTDRKILVELQTDAAQSLDDIARKVGSSKDARVEPDSQDERGRDHRRAGGAA